jgi:hypothetical protein
MCINYWKLNKATWKDHFLLPFIDEMLERLANHSFCYLDGYSSCHQILIHLDDQSKTTFICAYVTFAYRRMSFGLCNAPASFQRCMMAIFSELIEMVMEVFMDDFSVYGKIFEDCLANLDKKHCAISYASKTLTGPQLNYATTEKELLPWYLPTKSLDHIWWAPRSLSIQIMPLSSIS